MRGTGFFLFFPAGDSVGKSATTFINGQGVCRDIRDPANPIPAYTNRRTIVTFTTNGCNIAALILKSKQTNQPQTP